MQRCTFSNFQILHRYLIQVHAVTRRGLFIKSYEVCEASVELFICFSIWANVRKYEEHGTSLNRNKGNSGRRCTGRSEQNIAAVRQQLQQHPRGTSSTRKGLGLPSATFNRITRLDLHMHPYRVHIRHQLTERDFPRRFEFSRWLIARMNRDAHFLRNLVIGDETGFGMDGKVNSHNVTEYAPACRTPTTG